MSVARRHPYHGPSRSLVEAPRCAGSGNGLLGCHGTSASGRRKAVPCEEPHPGAASRHGDGGDRHALAQGPRNRTYGRLLAPASVVVTDGQADVGTPTPSEAQGSKWPADRVIVAYCRGSYCVYADDAIRALKDRGREAVRLHEGLPEWRRAGGPVEA
jgi:rhodanese-related sulfurtransferase